MIATRTGLRAAAVAFALGATGCSGFDRLDFTFQSAPPDNATITYEEIRIHEGIAVGVIVRAMDGDDELDADTSIELQSRDPGVLGIGLSPVDEDLDEDEAFPAYVLFGVAPGTSAVIVRVDGDREGEIPVVVEAQ